MTDSVDAHRPYYQHKYVRDWQKTAIYQPKYKKEILYHISITNEQLWPIRDRGPHRPPTRQQPFIAYKKPRKTNSG